MSPRTSPVLGWMTMSVMRLGLPGVVFELDAGVGGGDGDLDALGLPVGLAEAFDDDLRVVFVDDAFHGVLEAAGQLEDVRHRRRVGGRGVPEPVPVAALPVVRLWPAEVEDGGEDEGAL